MKLEHDEITKEAWPDFEKRILWKVGKIRFYGDFSCFSFFSRVKFNIPSSLWNYISIKRFYHLFFSWGLLVTNPPFLRHCPVLNDCWIDFRKFSYLGSIVHLFCYWHFWPVSFLHQLFKDFFYNTYPWCIYTVIRPKW